MSTHFAMRSDQHPTPAITDSWPAKDVAYVAIVGSIMLAAFLEWFLWLAAFLYCLCKVYQKAETTSVKVLAVIMVLLFTLLRLIFLPIMIVTLPLPRQVTQYFPEGVVSFLQWFAFWAFAGLLILPWLVCVYQLITKSIGRKSRIRHVLDEHSAPKVVIVMPCYNEEPGILLRTVDSLADCEYPPSCLHIFLSFDGDQENELYLHTIERLGVPLNRARYPKSIDIAYRNTRITVSRFPHGGKRACQKKTFKLIDKVYAEYLKRNDNLFVLFIDSDCILDKFCIQNFMYEMELKPGSKRNMLAMTGVITSTTEKNTLITLLQDMEYVHGQLFERTVESGCGAVTCLPGALTILRFSAFRKMAKYYFADKAEQCDDLFDYGKCHLGEDRWLTHLFMIGAKNRYQIQMNTAAFCKTEAVQSFRSLLKQRRRWFLGFITNEVCMLTDVRLWRRYPILCVVRLAQNTIRTTALLFFIMVIAIISTSQTVEQLPVGFIGVSLGLNWLLMLYFAAKLGRYKMMLYPLMFVVNPFFNWLYMVYGIFTAGQRTWGGPRADAAKADALTTPADAIAHAEEIGDDLNVVPETFKPAVNRKDEHTPLQPADKLDGRFAPAEELANGWYKHAQDSTLTIGDLIRRDRQAAPLPIARRTSLDSLRSGMSGATSVYWPRRVESFISPEDIRQYHAQMDEQPEAGGLFYESSPYRPQVFTHLPSRGRIGRPPSHDSTTLRALDLPDPYLPADRVPDLLITSASPSPYFGAGSHPPMAYHNRSVASSRDASPGRASLASRRSSASGEIQSFLPTFSNPANTFSSHEHSPLRCHSSSHDGPSDSHADQPAATSRDGDSAAAEKITDSVEMTVQRSRERRATEMSSIGFTHTASVPQLLSQDEQAQQPQQPVRWRTSLTPVMGGDSTPSLGSNGGDAGVGSDKGDGKA